MSRQRFLNHKVEITSRMSSYDIPKKLSQLETPYTDRNCLDTAIATNMIAVGMDVDRLGLMVVTGQPKQNSEYIQASLKHKLMLQSLSPLAFLTIVRNFKFTPVSELAENQSYWGEFVRLNNVLIVVFLLCATWILAAIISFISFTAFRWTDKKQGYQLSSFVEKEDASLNFFMTMIIPLLIDDVGTIQGAV